jgi:processive 1,2-diacylglycerol beta-glucosyltransferase
MTKVLILTAAFGEGHNAAARSLQAACRSENIDADVVDLFSKAHRGSYEQSRKAYLRLVNDAPWIWGAFYHLLHHLPLEHWLPFHLAPLRDALQSSLREFQPTIVLSVYPLYAALFESLSLSHSAAVASKPHFFTVVTDSITINAIWYRSGNDPLLLPNADTERVLEKAGVPRSRLRVSGFPVCPRFADSIAPRPDPADLPRPKVLIMVNGQPERALALFEHLQAQKRYHLTITVGHNETLRDKLLQSLDPSEPPPTILGWVDNVPLLLRSHHVLIGKAGGATVQETLAAATPMIMTQIFPGQEQGNAQLLIERDCGAFCPTAESVASTLDSWFRDNATRWRQLHQNALQLGRPQAAVETVRWILNQTSSRALPVDPR